MILREKDLQKLLIQRMDDLWRKRPPKTFKSLKKAVLVLKGTYKERQPAILLAPSTLHCTVTFTI